MCMYKFLHKNIDFMNYSKKFLYEEKLLYILYLNNEKYYYIKF